MKQKIKNCFAYASGSVYLQAFSLDYLHQGILLFAYSLLCFFTPFLIGEPQLAAGIAVNAFLILSALELQGWRLLPVIMLPSLGALSRGIVFGPFTPYLLLLVPFIWIGNALLVLSFKTILLKMKKGFGITLLAGSFIKSVFLFSSAFVLFSYSLLPSIFLSAMGAFQLATALAGGTIAYGIHKSGAARKLIGMAGF